jgi:CHAT domain-containing protein/Flp pilus assembly protein TadD
MRLSTAIILIVTTSVVAQDIQPPSNPEKGSSKPSKLKTVFADDFGNDTRSDYTIKGDSSWEEGRLTLAEGTLIEREINGGSRAKVTVRLESSELTPQQPQSELRVRLKLDGASDCYVRIRRQMEDGQEVSSVALIEIDEKEGKPITQLVRERELGTPASRLIMVEYRNGLVGVGLPERPFVAYISNGSARVVSVALESKGTSVGLNSFVGAAAQSNGRELTVTEKEQLATAEAHSRKRFSLNRQGKYAEAAKAEEKALEIRRVMLGAKHPDCALSLSTIATLSEINGDYARAERLHKQAIDIQKSELGAQHPVFAQSLNNLAVLYIQKGDYDRAKPHCEQALQIRKLVFGERHPSYAESLNNLAFLYNQLRKYALAVPLLKEAVEIKKSTVGKQHRSYARSLNNLAFLYYRMGDYSGAEPLFKQATEIQQAVLDSQHPAYAQGLHNLAMLYWKTGDYDAAEPLFKQAIEIQKATLGIQHPLYATSLNNFVGLCMDMGLYAEAEPILKSVVGIMASVKGEQHPDYATSLNNLAQLHLKMGNFEAAEPLYDQSRDIRRKVLGKDHPAYSESLNNVASLFSTTGDYARADRLFRQSLQIQLRHLEATAPIQAERQQRRSQNAVRFHLDNGLANAIEGGTLDATLVAGDLWRWKGAVTARQHAYRKVGRNPKLAPLFADLRDVAQQVSAEVARIPLPPAKPTADSLEAFREKRAAWDARFVKLRRLREDLEQQIAAGSLEFRRLRKSLTFEHVQSMLPRRSAFVDFLEYRHGSPDSNSKGKLLYESRYLALITTKNGTCKLVGLGSSKIVNDAISEFRVSLTEQRLPENPTTGEDRRLRELLWLPVEKHLAGIETVILSPDTALGTLPFAALPGRDPDSFLIEDYRLVTMPYTGLLRELAERDGRVVPKNRGLLVVGDVKYGETVQSDTGIAVVGKQGHSGRAGSQSWGALSGFSAELATIKNLHQKQFGSSTPLDLVVGTKATEGSFLDRAAHYETVHVITHGFFADPDARTIAQTDTKTKELDRAEEASTKLLPGLLSGLVMAGANNPTSLNDGILRASEIETVSLDGVDLVVLSACETGLGTTAGGEGLTGLQRAFQVAGARSVVASLWKVEDRATQELMKQFYTNLWFKKMSKINALRQAQLWMLNHPDELKAVGVANPSLRGKGKLPKVAESNDPAKQVGRTHPFYWAAFQLSGDWR